MGWGDEIMVTGQVRELYARDPRPVAVLDRDGRVRRHDIWHGNQKIIDARFTGTSIPQGAQVLRNGPGLRPYIAEKRPDRWKWQAWSRPRGEIFLDAKEKALGARYAGRVIVEPHLKINASPNKDWGWMRWNKLVWLLRAAGHQVSQMGTGAEALLDGVEPIETRSFREACAVMANARAAVLPEGGLHHAAAAFGVPAVVIFGGYISPAQTGYDLHTNLFTGGEPCGRRVECKHCRTALEAISPELVFTELEMILERSNAAATV
jgi:ADP-heptose:LPS heptosyltransferase